MPDLTLFKVTGDDEITSEDLETDAFAEEIRRAPRGAWARDQDWPVLFAQVEDEAGNEATLVVPFEEPHDFQSFLEDENLEEELVSADFDFDVLERIEEELA